MSLFTRNSTGNYHDSHEGTVTYASVRGERSFLAEAPPNSPHGAKLAQIAMSIQEDRPRRKPNSGVSRVTIPEGPRRPQIQYGSNVPRYDGDGAQRDDVRGIASPLRYDRVSREGNADNRNCPCCHNPTRPHRSPSYYYSMPDEDWETDVASIISTTRMDPYDLRHPMQYRRPHGQPQRTPSAPPTRQVRGSFPAQPTPHVTKYSTDTTTAYQVDSGNGRLYVSAPKGSNEARLFDAVAEEHSVQSQKKSYDSKEVNGGHGHRSKEAKRGWWW
ncbi:hypothetical protein F5X98DRAFT_377977 [Xylaria grammica]|nr:hypothetical protein F5X98DRAFT_377977 [Xylaria grammica]